VPSTGCRGPVLPQSTVLTARLCTGQVLRTKLLVTDDSFEFNRVLGRLKAMVAALPVVSPGDERELQVGPTRRG